MARGLCRNCYDRVLKEENPAYKARQLENYRRWRARNPDYFRSRERVQADRSKTKAKRRAELVSKLAEQGGECALCGRAEATWHYDHDHQTGAMRDVLCSKCNNGMGFFNDDPQRLREAADYIERHRQVPVR